VVVMINMTFNIPCWLPKNISDIMNMLTKILLCSVYKLCNSDL